ncbi:MAG: hypothetical protein O7F08_09275, partial [Deltaproteobacteria bacterium]|nr:hypothetical protein [Deltaproteobacteria bacterium]
MKRSSVFAVVAAAALTAQSVLAGAPVANPLLWLKSDEGVVETGSLVGLWEDQSGNGHDFGPPIPSDSPEFATGAVNGLPAIRFSGPTELRGSVGGNLSEATIFSLFRYTPLSSSNHYVYTIGTPGTSGSQMTLARRNGQLAYHYDGAIGNFPGTTCIPGGQWQVVSQVYGDGASTSHDLYQSQELILDTDATQGYSANGSTFVIGNYSSGSFGFEGDLVELLVYDRVLSAGQRSLVEDYLRVRAALTFGSSAEFASWEVVQYEFGAQPDAVWTACGGGGFVAQSVNADASIFLSDTQLTEGVVTGTMGAGVSPDFMGFVFGYQGRGNFYLFDWKSEPATFFGWPLAEADMSVRVINVAGGGDPDGADLWGSVDTTNTVTLSNVEMIWAGNVTYDFRLEFTSGSFIIEITSNGALIHRFDLGDDTY